MKPTASRDRFQAVNQAGAGPHSEQVNFRTPATNPDPVCTLTLLDLPGVSPSTCLHLKWEEPNCNGAEITSYVITLEEQTITVESGTCHLITDLQPDSEYRYWGSVPAPSCSRSITALLVPPSPAAWVLSCQVIQAARAVVWKHRVNFATKKKKRPFA